MSANGIRAYLQHLAIRAFRRLAPKPDQAALVRDLSAALRRTSEELAEASAPQARMRAEYIERSAELIEARQMAGAGPWLVAESRGSVNEKSGKLRESSALSSIGSLGEIDLMLSTVEWRREVNLSWLEFSRWGIQQIILISRLYYIKNPLIQRGVNVAAHYVFGRGVEVSSPDQDANDVLKEFFERNKSTLGQIALTDLERRKYYDGNLFFAFFADTKDKGAVSVRTIDATEVMDIVTNPEDTDEPWLYRRQWTRRDFDDATGQTSTATAQAWYPALGYEPEEQVPPRARVAAINDVPVMWDTPVLHRKCGAVSKWHFGCPLVYAALDWAKAAKKFLEACATVKQCLASVAITYTTKGGQQAIEGVKQQMQTSVGPPNSLWDTNPPPVAGSIVGMGPGSKMEVFNKGGGGDPDEVRQYKIQVAMVFGLPESFFSDMNTSNLATATSLDRPTQLNFLEKQEAWREDLTTIARFVLEVSMGAAGGQLREALNRRSVDTGKVVILEGARRIAKDGTWHYEALKAPKPEQIEVRVTFPTIIESDIPAMVTAISTAMTLANHGGQVVGIDERVGVGLMLEQFGVENVQEVLEEMYPDGEYDADRTKEVEPPPIPKAALSPGGAPQLPGGKQQPPPAQPKVKEALARLSKALKVYEDDAA
jgi:hypothetical protein